MKVIKKIRIGSSPLFESFEDFKSKDIDWVCLTEDYIGGDKAMRMKIGNDDIILYRDDYTKEDFIKEALSSNVPFKIGKFLIKEFVDFFKVTIEDLKKLDSLAKALDDKHLYEKTIYDSYILNNAFSLTEELLNKAYSEYKKYRPDEYPN